MPDGLCVDSDGCIWVAVAYASEVRRFAPSGELIDAVSVPTTVVTSCCFGGADMRDLYITSAAEYVPEDRRDYEPEAGGLYVYRAAVTGQHPHAFAG